MLRNYCFVILLALVSLPVLKRAADGYLYL